MKDFQGSRDTLSLGIHKKQNNREIISDKRQIRSIMYTPTYKLVNRKKLLTLYPHIVIITYTAVHVHTCITTSNKKF